MEDCVLLALGGVFDMFGSEGKDGFLLRLGDSVIRCKGLILVTKPYLYIADLSWKGGGMNG